MTFTTNETVEPQTASFYTDLEFSDKSVVITPMLDSTFGKEIRIAFKESQVMKEHKTKFPITVMILRGSIEFTVGEKMFMLNAGDVIALEGNVLHELKATHESVVRLSLHKSDSLERVKGVLKL
ncbi:MAG: cupin [Epsilonproteobacteria bacterium]|nr:MAG: cupin [Campylobacterota bacterium]